MSESVKSTRSYHSPRRRKQATETQRHILDNAQRLFEQRGYLAVSMGTIAIEADVASKTIYLAFGTKGGVLRAVWQRVLNGADDDDPVVSRAWFLEAFDETDPERQLRLNARNSAAVKQRAGAMLSVIRGAASADADAKELWQLIESDFHTNQASIVAALRKRRALRAGLSVAQATDLLWTINHPDLWRLLVIERKWTVSAYETWTADTACAQLLGPT